MVLCPNVVQKEIRDKDVIVQNSVAVFPATPIATANKPLISSPTTTPTRSSTTSSDDKTKALSEITPFSLGYEKLTNEPKVTTTNDYRKGDKIIPIGSKRRKKRNAWCVPFTIFLISTFILLAFTISISIVLHQRPPSDQTENTVYVFKNFT